jgi:hypothetical protein
VWICWRISHPFVFSAGTKPSAGTGRSTVHECQLPTSPPPLGAYMPRFVASRERHRALLRQATARAERWSGRQKPMTARGVKVSWFDPGHFKLV